jgi:hypothetical protein
MHPGGPDEATVTMTIKGRVKRSHEGSGFHYNIQSSTWCASERQATDGAFGRAAAPESRKA